MSAYTLFAFFEYSNVSPVVTTSLATEVQRLPLCEVTVLRSNCAKLPHVKLKFVLISLHFRLRKKLYPSVSLESAQMTWDFKWLTTPAK